MTTTKSETNTLSVQTREILSEFTGGSASNVEMMIGIGLVKDTEAVFFQYLDNDAAPQALVLPSGNSSNNASAASPVTKTSSIND